MKYCLLNLVWPCHIQNLGIFKTLVYSEVQADSESCQISTVEILLRTLFQYNKSRRPIYSKLAYSERGCVSYSLMYQLFFITTNLLLDLLLIDKNTGFSSAILFFQPLLSIWATGLSITQATLDIWQNLGYGLWVKRKEKYLHIRKCNSITNNS